MGSLEVSRVRPPLLIRNPLHPLADIYRIMKLTPFPMVLTILC